MIIAVNQLNEGEPIPLASTYDSETLDLGFVDFRYLNPVTLTGAAERTGELVVVRGEMASEIEQICGRCLRGVRRAITTPFELSYEVGDHENIDTTGDLRDLLMLNHPDRFLCSENCRGICTKCGKNLNQDTCTCQEPAPSTAQWEPLKKILKKEKS